jgi:hypothetical protein
MIIVREHVHIGPHVVHNHREPLKQGIDGLTGEMSEVLILSPGSTLVLRLNQETMHDFILLFMPPCGPHLTPLVTGSLERSLIVFSTP